MIDLSHSLVLAITGVVMAKSKVKIDKDSGLAYIPKNLRDEGFVGELDCMPNALTLTLIRPGVSLEQTKKSLQVIIKDIELQIEHERANR